MAQFSPMLVQNTLTSVPFLTPRRRSAPSRHNPWCLQLRVNIKNSAAPSLGCFGNFRLRCEYVKYHQALDGFDLCDISSLPQQERGEEEAEVVENVEGKVFQFPCFQRRAKCRDQISPSLLLSCWGIQLIRPSHHFARKKTIKQMVIETALFQRLFVSRVARRGEHLSAVIHSSCFRPIFRTSFWGDCSPKGRFFRTQGKHDSRTGAGALRPA